MIKGTAETREVTINGNLLAPEASQAIRNHSPDGFNWGYSGSGPAQLALALMLEFLGDKDKALRSYQQFKSDVIAGLPQGKDFTLPESVVWEWLQKNNVE